MTPRVVPNQKAKFNHDEQFQRLSRISEIRYTGHMNEPEIERRRKFKEDCAAGSLDIVYFPSGCNLELQVEVSLSDLNPSSTTSDIQDIDSDSNKVHMSSHFILNGVCVKWVGWINQETLAGQGALEFDEEGAEREARSLEEQIQQLERPMFTVPQEMSTSSTVEVTSTTT